MQEGECIGAAMMLHPWTLRLTLEVDPQCRRFGCRASDVCVYCVCVFITAGPIIKLCAGGEGDSEGHVL